MKRTIETAKKYLAMEAPNGYKFNASRYLKNPAMSCEYPAFIKQIKEDENYIYYKQVYFFKHYDKTASVYVETFSRAKSGGDWQVVNNNPSYSEKVVETLPSGARYNANLLFKYCE